MIRQRYDYSHTQYLRPPLSSSEKPLLPIHQASYIAPIPLEANQVMSQAFSRRRRINRIVNTILSTQILIVLAASIYILYHVVSGSDPNNAYAVRIGVLLVFTLAFSAVLSLFTAAKRHEILAAASAYCAVLVVFVGNVGPLPV